MRKNILLIGSEGYIGASLVNALLSTYSIDTCDILPSKMCRDFHFQVNYGELTRIEISKYDFIILLAAHSSVSACIENPSEAVENNIVNFMRLLTNMNSNQTLIYASSGSVYDGYMNSFPKEDAKILSSRNIYDFSKISNDLMASTFQIPTIGLRFGTLSGYSPIMREDLIINKMTKDALDHKTITVSNASAFRSCLGMQDLCNAILTLINQRGKILEQTAIFNLASFSKSIEQISDEIAKKMRVERKYTGDSPTYNFSMSVEKFERVFNFQFLETIDKIVDGLIANISN